MSLLAGNYLAMIAQKKGKIGQTKGNDWPNKKNLHHFEQFVKVQKLALILVQ